MMFIKLDLPIKSIEQGRTKLPALLNPFTGYSYLALSIEECITELPPHKKWSSFILRQLMSVVSFSASTRTVNPQTIASHPLVPWKTLGKVLHSSSIPLLYWQSSATAELMKQLFPARLFIAARCHYGKRHNPGRWAFLCSSHLISDRAIKWPQFPIQYPRICVVVIKHPLNPRTTDIVLLCSK